MSTQMILCLKDYRYSWYKIHLTLGLCLFLQTLSTIVSARAPDADWIASDEVRIKLAENGVSKIYSIQPDATGWAVKARLGGKNLFIHVDPYSGQITDRRDDPDADEQELNDSMSDSKSKCNPVTGKNCKSPLNALRDNCAIVTGKRCDPKGETIFEIQRRNY